MTSIKQNKVWLRKKKEKEERSEKKQCFVQNRLGK